MKKTLSLLLAAAMALSLLAGCGSKHNNDASQSAAGSGSASASQSQQGVEKTGVNFMALSGPTGVGAAYLMKYYSAETSPADCPVALNSTVVADNKEVTDALVNGTADIAAVATNVAATLAAKTDGGIQVLAVNTLGVLYILEKGDSVQSMADLAGKTVYATGQGANPEYVLNYLLTQNGVDPSQVDIQWMTAQEVTAQMASGDSAICMLPVPAATALMMKDQGVRQALSLSDEWDKLGQGSLAMGCVVGRTQFIEEHPETVDAFLDLYGHHLYERRAWSRRCRRLGGRAGHHRQRADRPKGHPPVQPDLPHRGGHEGHPGGVLPGAVPGRPRFHRRLHALRRLLLWGGVSL